MMQPFLAELLCNRVGVIWNRFRHPHHFREERFRIKAQLRRQLLPLPPADIAETVFPSKPHGQPDSVRVEIRIRQDAREIVQRSKPHLPAGAEHKSVVLGVRVSAGNQPVECNGVQKVAGILLGICRVGSQNPENRRDPRTAFTFIFPRGRKANGLAHVLLMDAL